MSIFEKIALAVSNADQDAYSRCPNSESTTILAIGWSVIIASVTAGVAFFVFLQSLSGSFLIGGIGSFVMVVIIVLYDRTLLRDESVGKLILRFAMSIAIAVIISVPVKVHLAEQNLKDHIVEVTALHNQGLIKQVDAVRDELDDQLQTINDGIIEASVKEGGRITQTQVLVEYRRQKNELLETRDQKIEEVQASIEGQFQEPDTSFMGQMATFIDLTLHPSKSSDPIALFLNIAILLLFILTESMPSILRATMQNSVYIKAVSFKNGLIERIQAKIEDLQNLLVECENHEMVEAILARIDYYQELCKTATTELRTTDALKDLYRKVLDEERRLKAYFDEEGSTATPSPAPPSSNGVVKTDPDTEEEPTFTY